VHLPTSGASPGLDPPLTVSLSTLVVAVDGGTIGLDVSFGAFLAVILGLFIPVVFLVTLYIQSEAQGTATSFREVATPSSLSHHAQLLALATTRRPSRTPAATPRCAHRLNASRHPAAQADSLGGKLFDDPADY